MSLKKSPEIIIGLIGLIILVLGVALSIRIVSLLGSLIFLGLSCYWWYGIYTYVFKNRNEKALITALAFGTTVVLASIIGGISIVVYAFTKFTFIVSLIILAFVSWKAYKIVQAEFKKNILNLKSKKAKKTWKWYHGVIALYGALWCFSLFGASGVRSEEILKTPWATLPQEFFYLILVTTFLLGLIIFLKQKKKSVNVIIVLLIAQSILVHSYLPLSHTLPWGGDVWRLTAIENIIVAEEPVYPTLFPIEEGRYGVGALLQEPQKASYAPLWWLVAAITTVTGISILQIYVWLMAILWSIFMPALLFVIGRTLFKKIELAALLPYGMLLFFSYQALGGLTLPVSLGYISLFFVLMWWLLSLEHRSKSIKNIAGLFTILLIGSYALAPIIVWSLGILLFAFLQKEKIKSIFLRKSIGWLVILISISALPLIELASGYNRLATLEEIWWQVKQFLGQFSGWFYATAIRPHDMLTGNTFFNHTPEQAFISFGVNNFRWVIIPVMLALAIGFMWGLVKLYKGSQQNQKFKYIFLLTIMVTGGYLAGWIFLEGDLLLVRRLDVALAFVVLITAIYGWQTIVERFKLQIGALTIMILLAFATYFGGIAYASGPDIRVMSMDELKVAEFLWQETASEEIHCVVADTWVLLGVEAFSAQQVVGGGFPIDYQFSQPDRVELSNQIKVKPSVDLFNRAKELTGADVCIAAFPTQELSSEAKNRLNNNLDTSDLKEQNGYIIWKF